MKLTKKYRIVWNSQREMLNDPYHDMTGTETAVGQGRNAFESVDLAEIKKKIKELKLKPIENEKRQD